MDIDKRGAFECIEQFRFGPFVYSLNKTFAHINLVTQQRKSLHVSLGCDQVTYSTQSQHVFKGIFSSAVAYDFAL